MAEKSKGIQNSSIYILKGTPFQTLSETLLSCTFKIIF